VNLFALNIDLGRISMPWRKPAAVLIVEDNPATAALMQHGAEAAGLLVVVAATAEEAVGILRNNGKRFVHAVIDVGLPHGDGWSLYDAIRAEWPALPICMASAAAEKLARLPYGKRVSVYLKSHNYTGLFREIKDGR
jgi:CheY-like chemotaxis protein